MLITDEQTWSYDAFEACIEGMCDQLRSFPEERVTFWADSTPEVIFLFFAIWKLGKIACPMSRRLPTAAVLFTPMPVQPKRWEPWELKEERLATMLLTSGTTGTPKVACHSIGNHLYSALGSQTVISLTRHHIWHLSLPLHHVGGIAILFRCYLSRARIYLGKDYAKATHLSLVPTQLFRLLRDGVQLPRVESILLGGAPLTTYETPWRILPTYGMTEMSSQIATDGKVLPYGEVRLAPDGEILVRGKTLFQGYLEGGLPVDDEGWFATKDLGRFEKGKLAICGRKDNLFISGGENIQPEEIEGVIKRLLPVEEAIVVPMPDAEFGARPVLFMRPELPLAIVQEALRSSLPKYKIPVRIYPLPEEAGLKPNRQKIQF